MSSRDLRVVAVTLGAVAMVILLLVLAFGGPALAPHAQHTDTGMASISP